jgi:hypothetical protein
MPLTRNHRRSMVLCLAAWVAAPLFARTVHAAVVLPKGAKQPVMGYLVRQDDRMIVIREELPGGKSRESSFARKDLDELIFTISPERLTALDPNKPQTYWEYAEELAEKKRDPEARDTAIRLYAIAAARGDNRIRHSALLGLIALARNNDEERLFRAAAYLFDSDHDPSILTASAAATGDASLIESSWAAGMSIRSLAPLASLSLDRLTEFDPAACAYRGGKWIKP